MSSNIYNNYSHKNLYRVVQIRGVLYVQEFKWKCVTSSRSSNRRSQGEGCTPAALRTFPRLSRTSMRFPSKPYERPSFFRRKGNQFSGQSEEASRVHCGIGGSAEFPTLRDRGGSLRRIVGERSRRDCCLLDESAPWSSTARTHIGEAGNAQDLHEALCAALPHPAGRNAQDGHDAGYPAHSS